jgi:hypothetical protein
MWMDGALTGALFVSPCPWANQGGELKLTFFFPFLSPGLIFFGTFLFLTPHARPGLTYLHFRLLAYRPWPPPSPTYLPTDLLTYLPIYLLTYVPTH